MQVSQSNIERFEQLSKLYSLTQRFPVWPLDMTTIGRFIVAGFFPIFAAVLIELLTQYIVGLFP